MKISLLDPPSPNLEKFSKELMTLGAESAKALQVE
jgi:hypothetical protein